MKGIGKGGKGLAFWQNILLMKKGGFYFWENSMDLFIYSDEIETIHIYNDEHSTATNGRYELWEGLEQEFKLGTYNLRYDKFFPPVFGKMKGIELLFCDSNKVTLIRAADIVADRIYFMALNRKLKSMEGIYLSTLP